jgi:AraC-like DNA-binding protein
MSSSESSAEHFAQQQERPRQPDGRADKPDDCTIVRFSSEDIPAHDRLGHWNRYRDCMSLRAEIEPVEGHPFTSHFTSHIVPELRVLAGYISPVRVRPARDRATDRDDFTLFINRTGAMAVSSRDRAIPLGEGDAVLVRADDFAGYDRASSGRSLSLRIPGAALSPLVADIDAAVMRLLPRESQALELLTGYVSLLMERNTLASPLLRRHAVGHVYDLVGLMLGPAGEVAQAMRNRGGRAARLQAAKIWIANNSRQPDLSVGAVAQQLGMTPRYLQRLFEADDSTFSTFLLGLRLAHAHHLLSAPQLADRPVSLIAYEVGFGDLSYFNRCFRRLYGVTPRDIRAPRANPSSFR